MIGPHETHACMIQFAPKFSEPKPEPETRNVFEENE